MANSKMMYIMLIFLIYKVLPSMQEGKLSCTCGAFNSEKRQDNDAPILEESLANVTCNDAGTVQCAEICKSLVVSVKEKAPEFLCKFLDHTDKIKPSLYSKVCEKDWLFTGMSFDDFLCCHDGKVIACP